MLRISSYVAQIRAMETQHDSNYLWKLSDGKKSILPSSVYFLDSTGYANLNLKSQYSWISLLESTIQIVTRAVPSQNTMAHEYTTKYVKSSKLNSNNIASKITAINHRRCVQIYMCIIHLSRLYSSEKNRLPSTDDLLLRLPATTKLCVRLVFSQVLITHK